jgi:hypothetical protein
MHPEIEKFIDLTLVDGILTEQERKIIYKKAQENGCDLEELEIVLAAKLYEKQQSIDTKPKSEKLGGVKKCPACGSEVQSFQINCVACNHEFNNIDANVSIQKLFILLNECEKERGNQEFSVGSALGNIFARAYGIGGGDKVIEKKKSIISGFPIPNTREDILEFLDKSHNDLAPTWFSKCEQVIMKARFAMKDDQKTIKEIEYYANQFYNN